MRLAHYKKALAIEPANPVSLNNVGETMDRMGAHQHAVAHYELVFTKHTPARNNVPVFAMMHTNYAVALFALQRTDDALRELDVALRLDPTSAEASYTKGAILFNVGRVQEAIPWLERAVRGAPFNARFRESLDAARAAVGNR